VLSGRTGLGRDAGVSLDRAGSMMLLAGSNANRSFATGLIASISRPTGSYR